MVRTRVLNLDNSVGKVGHSIAYGCSALVEKHVSETVQLHSSLFSYTLVYVACTCLLQIHPHASPMPLEQLIVTRFVEVMHQGSRTNETVKILTTATLKFIDVMFSI